MNRLFAASALCAALAVSVSAQQTPQTTPAPARPPVQPLVPKLQVGDKAPDFNLQGTDGKNHKLSEFKGKTLVLAWFPQAFTGG